MNIKRVILSGVAIWIIGILFYSISYYVPIMGHADTQANLVLFITIMPSVWFACSFYYKKDRKTHGYKVGQAMLLTAVVLDALLTVPFFVIPKGGSHYSFFTSLGFWIIAIEFLIVAVLYWYTRVYPHNIPSNQTIK